MATIPSSAPLYERTAIKNTMGRAMDLIVFLLLVALLVQRLLSLKDHGLPWFIAFLCESWFTFIWILTMSTKWNPVECKTYPQRLAHRASELPPVDMFVTTADPVLEPPIITVNTVLSLLAVDYPAHKLACYVSDDGASALTFYSLVEAIKFAKLWVPFCKKYGVQIRAPFRHFSEENNLCLGEHQLLEYQQERKKMKDEYQRLVEKIENETQNLLFCVGNNHDVKDFCNIERRNHPSIVKVIWENKEGQTDGLPNLIYVSREKRPKHPHHYKAGAMNVLVRVSGLMTNAPFMLNVDCDMYANNPLVVRHAMCLLLGAKDTQSGYVQFLQNFYDGPGETLLVLQQFLGRGLDGLQGPFYQGSNCFHRRKLIYGSRPEDFEMKQRHPLDEKLILTNLRKTFGNSDKLAESVAKILSEPKAESVCQDSLSSFVDEAKKVASCDFEFATSWGKDFGWMYGATAEDVLTGLKIQARGWKSAYCIPNPPAFLGCAPSDIVTAIIQQKRWATGLLEILFSRHNPLSAALNERLQFRQCLGYMWVLLWGLRSIPELCYALLPAYCLITNSYFLPKGLAICVPAALFVIYNMSTLSEYLQTGASTRAWWSANKTGRITSATAWVFGAIGVLTKLLGISEPVFEVTQKGQEASTSDNGFTFNKSPVFIPATVVSMVHLMAMLTVLLGFQLPGHGSIKVGIGELCCSLWILMCFWPFIEGLFRKGRHGIPATTIFKSATLVLLLLRFFKWTSTT